MNTERCTWGWTTAGVTVARCCLASGHAGEHRYRCAGESCPGLVWPASVMPHPSTCVAEVQARPVESRAGAVLRVAAGAEQASELVVNGWRISVHVQRMRMGAATRASVRASGARGSIMEVIDLRGEASPPRMVIEICDVIWRVVDLAGIDRARLAPGNVIDTIARAGRPTRAADALVHALAWAAWSVAEAGGI